jgi:hypothetical protein
MKQNPTTGRTTTQQAEQLLFNVAKIQKKKPIIKKADTMQYLGITKI